MTRPREEIARLLLERWGQPDFGAGLLTDDFVMEQHGGTMQGVYRGAQGMRDYAEGFGESAAPASRASPTTAGSHAPTRTRTVTRR